jgi:hypothetical protein
LPVGLRLLPLFIACTFASFALTDESVTQGFVEGEGFVEGVSETPFDGLTEGLTSPCVGAIVAQGGCGLSPTQKKTVGVTATSCAEAD